MPKEYVNVSVKATLKGGSILLKDRKAKDIADVAFKNLGYLSHSLNRKTLILFSRPRGHMP